MSTLLVYAVLWLGFVPLAILNGTIRVKGYARYMSELAAHQVSTASAIVLFGAYVWIAAAYHPFASGKEAALIGGMWLGMTVAFEFLFGHYVMGHPWPRLLHDYNVFQGRIWVLVLIWIAIVPFVAYFLRA